MELQCQVCTEDLKTEHSDFSQCKSKTSHELPKCDVDAGLPFMFCPLYISPDDRFPDSVEIPADPTGCDPPALLDRTLVPLLTGTGWAGERTNNFFFTYFVHCTKWRTHHHSLIKKKKKLTSVKICKIDDNVSTISLWWLSWGLFISCLRLIF